MQQPSCKILRFYPKSWPSEFDNIWPIYSHDYSKLVTGSVKISFTFGRPKVYLLDHTIDGLRVFPHFDNCTIRFGHSWNWLSLKVWTIGSWVEKKSITRSTKNDEWMCGSGPTDWLWVNGDKKPNKVGVEPKLSASWSFGRNRKWIFGFCAQQPRAHRWADAILAMFVRTVQTHGCNGFKYNIWEWKLSNLFKLHIMQQIQIM